MRSAILVLKQNSHSQGINKVQNKTDNVDSRLEKNFRSIFAEIINWKRIQVASLRQVNTLKASHVT